MYFKGEEMSRQLKEFLSTILQKTAARLRLLDHTFSNLASLILLVCLSVPSPMPAFSMDDLYRQKRQKMVQLIEEDARQISLYYDMEAMDPRVLQVMGKVPRHKFVNLIGRINAYKNIPLAIGYGQTISQPYIVALMTDLIKPSKTDKVLEIGTGSGYQAAVLSKLVQHVYTIEIISPLGKQAKGRFKDLDYHNITSRIGDGYYGWKEHAPFDAIIVTAAASHIPHPLIEQLKPGGRMVIPVGSRFMTQQLLLITKTLDGKLQTRQLLPVRFVPLTGKH